MGYLSSKRCVDLVLAILLILIISPVLLIVSFLLLIFNNGEVIFFQRRLGLDNKYFYIFKFGTMNKESINLPGGGITLRNDPRVTKIGKILRISKLNELPQLFNVFIGNMSFVGPRPLMQEGYNLFSDDTKEILYKSKPGITGISSIVFRDEEKLVTESGLEPLLYYKNYIFPYKSQLEIWYFKNKSLSVDLLIIILTGIKVIFPKSNLEFKIFKSLPKDSFFHFS
jgi:lipopolysaccharide/colanic/teichoic acid biosynthesis glycosyltransferase